MQLNLKRSKSSLAHKALSNYISLPDKFQAASNLADYIRYAKHDLSGLAYNNKWESWKWHGIGSFIKQEFINSGKCKDAPISHWLDPQFIDFAKAYIRERHSHNPGEVQGTQGYRLRALRLLEMALLEVKRSGDPADVDQAVLNHACTLAEKMCNGQSIPDVGRHLQFIASLLNSKRIVVSNIGSWVSPLRYETQMGISVGSAGDKFRSEKLPDPAALNALAEIFNHDLDPNDPAHQRDIYSTSITALLLSAPSRAGFETHHLPVNLLFKATDSFGKEQTGLRWEAGKGFGSYVKWVWEGMAPVAEIALNRLTRMTEEARNLARWMEDPKTSSLFYRHSDCPDVDENQLLTTKQVCAALGITLNGATAALRKINLENKDYRYSLHDLWISHVIPERHKKYPYFPYIDAKESAKGKKGGLKFSEALFCMRAKQLHPKNPTSPVKLWFPTLPRYLQDVGLSNETRTSIFDRHGYRDSNGNPLTLRSHSVRHLLNTEGQRGKMTNEQIAWWSGRINQSQNQVYNHMTEQERVDRAKHYLKEDNHQVEIVSFDSKKNVFTEEQGRQNKIPPTEAVVHGYWHINFHRKTASHSNFEVQPQLAGINTLYGRCEHDYVLSPCEGFAQCLDCSDHVCIKENGSDDKEKLSRIKELMHLVKKEIDQAKEKVDDGDWGTQEWHTAQVRWHEKLQSLVDILQSTHTPEGAIIKLAGANSQTHLHRVLRSAAMIALEADTSPRELIQEMLDAIIQKDNEDEAIKVTLASNKEDSER